MAVVIIVIVANCNNTNIVLLLEIMDHYISKTDRKFKLNVFTKGKQELSLVFYMRKPTTSFFKKVPFSVSFIRVCKQRVGETTISEEHSGHLKLTNECAKGKKVLKQRRSSCSGQKPRNAAGFGTNV